VTVCAAARDSVRRELRAAGLSHVEVRTSEYVAPTQAVLMVHGRREVVQLNPLHVAAALDEMGVPR
jgi:hypothetical protein